MPYLPTVLDPSSAKKADSGSLVSCHEDFRARLGFLQLKTPAPAGWLQTLQRSRTSFHADYLVKLNPDSPFVSFFLAARARRREPA